MPDSTTGGATTSPSYNEVLGQRESGGQYDITNNLGYIGKYQMGGMALQDVGLKDSDGNWTGKNGIHSQEDFLASPEVQEQTQSELVALQEKYLTNNGAMARVGQEFQGQPVTKEGLLMASHLVGAKGVLNMLETGKVPDDANGTKATEYLKLGNSLTSTPIKEVGATKQDSLAVKQSGKRGQLADTSTKKQALLGGLQEDQAAAIDKGRYEYLLGATSEDDFNTRSAFYDKAVNDAASITAKNELEGKKAFFDTRTTGGKTGNALLGAVNTTARIIGGAASLPFVAAGSALLSQVTPEQMALYQSSLSTPEDQFTNEEKGVINHIQNAMDQYEFAGKVQETTTFLSEHVDQRATEKFMGEASESFAKFQNDEISAWELAKESGSILTNNLEALGQVTVESLPYMVAAAYSMPLSVATHYSNEFTTNLESFRENHDGKNPVGEELATLNAVTLGQAIVDMVGDRLATGGAKTFKATAGVVLGKETVEAITSKSAASAASSVVVGGTGEFIAESGADVLGQYAGTQDADKIDYTQSYAAGLLGLGSGGLTAGVVNTPALVSSTASAISETETASKVTEAGTKAKDAVKERASSATSGVRTRKTYQEAVKTGDVTSLPEQNDDNFDSTEDVKARHAILKTTTDPVARQELMDGATASRQVALDKLTKHQSGEEVIPEAEQAAFLQEFKAGQAAIRAMRAEFVPANISTTATSLATAANTTNAQQGVQKVLGSMALNPESVTAEQAEAILGNHKLVLTPQERIALKNHVEIYKNIDQVSSDVLNGGKGKLGVNQYLQAIPEALALGDTKSAEILMDDLNNFRESQNQKVVTGKLANGKPIKGKLVETVKAELAMIDAAIAKLQGDISTEASNPTPTAETPVTEAPVATDSVVADSEQQATEASAEEAVVAEEAVADTPVTKGQEDSDLTAAIQQEVSGLGDKAPADVNQLVNSVYDANEQGVTFDDTISNIKAQYGDEVAKAVSDAISKDNPQSNATHMSTKLTAQEGDTKVPVKPEGITLSSWVKSYNWVKAYFVSKPIKQGTKPGILQTDPSLMEDPSQYGRKVSTHLGRNLTPSEVVLAKNVYGMVKNFKQTFASKVYTPSKVSKEGETFEHNNPYLYLTDETGNIDQGVQSAIGITLFNWITTRGPDTLVNTEDSLRSMFNIDKKTDVPSSVWEIMEGTGVGETTLINSLGKDVLKMLNIKATNEAFYGLEESLVTSLGATALEILREGNWVQAKTISDSAMESAKVGVVVENTVSASALDNRVFYSLKHTKSVKGSLEPVASIRNAIDNFSDANKSAPKGATKFMEGVFGIESYLVTPAFTRPTTTPETMSRTDKKLGKEIKRGIAKQQNRAHMVRVNSYNAFNNLGEEAALKVMGYTDPSNVHVSKRVRQSGINGALERSLRNFNDFLGELTVQNPEGKFWFNRSVWKNLRIGVAQNQVDAQGDKMHRAFVAPEAWTQEVQLNDLETMGVFWESMDEHLGINTQADFFANPEMVSAAQAIQELLLNNAYPVGGVEAIVRALEGKSAGPMALHDLTEIASYLNAVDAGATSFVTSSSLEVDGKTNGPAIAVLQYLGGTKDRILTTLEKVGLFREGTYKTVNEYSDANPKDKDLYIDFGANWQESVNEIPTVPSQAGKSQAWVSNVISAADRIFGSDTIGGLRNLSKNPFMILFYGAGESKIKEGIVVAFNDSVINKLEAVAQSINQGNLLDASIAYGSLQKDLKAITFKEVLPNINFKDVDAASQVLSLKISPDNQKTIDFRIGKFYGDTATDTLRGLYPELLQNRQAVTTAYEYMYRMYSLAREELIAGQLTEAIDKGQVVKGVTYLTKEQVASIESSLQQMQPYMHNYFSKQSMNINQANSFGKTSVVNYREGTGSGAFKVEAGFKGRTRTLSASLDLPASPGAAPGVMAIHQLDATVQHLLFQGDLASVDVHDAMFWGVKDAKTGAVNQNKAFFDVMSNMNVLKETAVAFNGAKQQYDAAMGHIPTEVRYASLEQMDPESFLSKQLADPDNLFPPTIASVDTEINNLANSSLKGEVLNEIKYVHQYADTLGVGAYETSTSEDAANIKDAVEAGKANVKGSSGTESSINPDDYASAEVVDAMNVLGVFDALPNVGGKQESVEHKDALRTNVHRLATKLTGPFNVYLRETNDQLTHGIATSSDIYITNLVSGRAPTSTMLAQGVLMSSEEVMAHELNHLVYSEGFERESGAKRAIERLMLAAKQQLDSSVLLEDPATATQEEIEGAQATWDHLFNNKQGNQLEEFAAFGTTNERFIAAINTVTLRPDKIFTGSPYQMLINVLNYLVDIFSAKINKVDGLTNDKKLGILLDNMLRVSSKKKGKIVETYNKAFDLVGNALALPVKGAIKLGNMTADSNFVVNNRFGVVKKSGAIVRGLRGVEVDDATAHTMKVLNTYRDLATGQKYGFFQDLMDEIIGRTVGNARFRDLARRATVMVDQSRKKAKEATIKHIHEAFKTSMEEQDWKAVNKILLKLDIDSIADLGLETIEGLITDPIKLQDAINTLETQLGTYQFANFYIRQAKDLGYFMNTGAAKEAATLLNAHNISKLFGDVVNRGKVSDLQAASAEVLIDKLATLYGLQQAPLADLARMGGIMARERLADPINNGVTTTINTHKALKLSARKQFSSDEEYKALFIKGFTKETYKEGVGIEIATLDKEQELLDQGYIRQGKVVTDKAAPIQDQMYLYYAPDGALAPYMSTIASLTSNVAKGSDTIKVNMQVGTANPQQAGQVDSVILTNRKAKAIAEMHRSTTPAPKVPSNNNMIPIVNPKGNIVGWRYMMTELNKDTLLGKENDGAEVLGSMAANIVDKVESQKVNAELVRNAKEQYDEDYTTRSSAYVEVGPNSTDPILKEVYQMMPDTMRDVVRNVWGGPTMQIRKDLVTQMFGYRKATIKSLFSKDPAARRLWENVIVEVGRTFLGNKAALRLRQAENILMAIVQEVKDIVVVKSMVITMGNILSNTMLLVLNGVNPVSALQLQWEGMRGSNQYIKDRNSIQASMYTLQTNTLSKAQRTNIEGDIARLRRRIATNPVTETINAGLLPTIVDDVAADSELSNTVRGKTQQRLSKGIDSVIGKHSAVLAGAVKVVAGLPDTPVYRLQNQLVMQSDFMGRYAVMQHWVAKETAEKGRALTSDEMNNLVGEAQELFINFDTPTHKGIQYANDMGLAWFTKYKLRVQRSIARTFVKNPVKATSSLLGIDLAGFDAMWDTPIGGSVFGGTSPLSVVDGVYDKATGLTDMASNMHISGAL